MLKAALEIARGEDGVCWTEQLQKKISNFPILSCNSQISRLENKPSSVANLAPPCFPLLCLTSL